MSLSKIDGLELPASADFHVHLRYTSFLYQIVALLLGAESCCLNS
jgi:hypothetical protein